MTSSRQQNRYLRFPSRSSSYRRSLRLTSARRVGVSRPLAPWPLRCVLCRRRAAQRVGFTQPRACGPRLLARRAARGQRHGACSPAPRLTAASRLRAPPQRRFPTWTPCWVSRTSRPRRRPSRCAATVPASHRRLGFVSFTCFSGCAPQGCLRARSLRALCRMHLLASRLRWRTVCWRRLQLQTASALAPLRRLTQHRSVPLVMDVAAVACM